MSQAGSSLPSTPGELLEVAWRRKWLILVPVLVIGGAAAFLAYALPPLYRSSTTILVVKAKVPETFVRSTVTTDIEDRLATITQQILSRSRLERVVLQFDLYREARARQPLDAVIAGMRQAVEIDVVKGNTAFTVSFSGPEPRLVRDVTNELAAFFIEENSKVREELAASTSEFLDAQLAALKQTLAEQETRVRDFKERYMGSLPQQQEANLRALDRLQVQAQSVADQIRAAEERRLLLQAQLATVPRVTEVVRRTMRPVGEIGGASLAPGSVPRDPAVARLEEARSALRLLETRYTALHPDVVRARRQVEELEALVGTSSGAAGAQAAAAASPGSPRLVAVDEAQEVPNPLFHQIEAQMVAAEREIGHLRQGHRELLGRIEAIQRKVETVPKLEQQLLELTRDYNNTQATYEALLSKKLDAQIAENLEKRQKGEQFRVLDAATLPQTPHRPDRRRLLALGAVLALGSGMGAALGREAVDGTVRGPRQLRTVAPRIPLLGTVPVVRDQRTLRRRRLAGLALGVLLLAAYGALGFAALRYREVIVKIPVLAALGR